MKVNTELSLFDSALAKKPQVVAVNKIDLPPVRTQLAEMGETSVLLELKSVSFQQLPGRGFLSFWLKRRRCFSR